MRAIGYVRVSTDKQADHGVSLEGVHWSTPLAELVVLLSLLSRENRRVSSAEKYSLPIFSSSSSIGDTVHPRSGVSVFRSTSTGSLAVPVCLSRP